MKTKKIAYCINCDCKNEVTITTNRKEATVKGIQLSFVLQSARCSKCGEEVYVPEINDNNVIIREEAYRHAAQLITVAEVNQILDKYNIGAGPLAKIMGLGNVTINRYVGGQIPSRKNSFLLLEVLSSHKKLEEYLENNKDHISSVAYKKCHETIDRINELYGENKIDVATRYLLTKSKDITPLALQKLLYYTQSFFYAFFGKEIFVTPCVAWTHGPVYTEVYHKYKEYGYDPIKKPTSLLADNFTELLETEISFLDTVIAVFGQYSGSILERFTHKEDPWKEARESLQAQDRCSNELSRESIHDYFKRVVDKYHIDKPNDMINYCIAMRNTI